MFISLLGNCRKKRVGAVTATVQNKTQGKRSLVSTTNFVVQSRFCKENCFHPKITIDFCFSLVYVPFLYVTGEEGGRNELMANE